ncbi:alpha/beta hydrolase [Pseudosulfitobacter koreensis]|uniref:Alpha/beta hydrolase n=1 Tax=Pseudosulfitobacter koreensis TaxID=2968472 RepID=A0ABT1Z4L4_9RHOB|nr:alpha/beta hydrolase [Pseudosulfitobacter koreense]MCR8828066.1 alpha/beta hydrolase [Pseudosulfitobacter koreense]
MWTELILWGALAAGIVLAIPLLLIASQRMVPMAGAGDVGVDLTVPIAVSVKKAPPTGQVLMRDGFALQCRRYATSGRDVPLIVMVHSSAWHGVQFHDLASSLSDVADVLVPDLRGHGPAPGRRGDVTYIGQLEDDIADLIADQVRPGQRVMMVGHSVGGGFVLRMAGGEHGALIDRVVLLAPFLNHFAATMRRTTSAWVRLMVRRLVGLALLNTLGIRALNHLPVVQFNMPPEILGGPQGDAVTTFYTYRLDRSYLPRNDFRRDIAALPPFTVVVGTADEAFYAEAYAPLMRAVTDRGLYHIVPGVGHMAIVDAPETRAAIRAALHALEGRRDAICSTEGVPT